MTESSFMRQTKIVATMGPATDRPGVLEGLITAGVDVVRLNFSHGSADEHEVRAHAVRQLASAHGRDVAILADLQGPKIRVCNFAEGPIQLAPGDAFILDAELGDDEGDQHAVGITYKEMPGDVSSGDLLLLNDGRITLNVDRVEGAKIHTIVKDGGQLSDRKGVNRLGGGLSAQALSKKDIEDIKTVAAIEADYMAVSFPRSGNDMLRARTLLEAAGGQARLVAKIERAEALDCLEEIIEASDAVMVARGDLGVEISDAELPGVQKRVISLTREMNRLCITATQMMESMIESPIPTRAEVLDVANAVMDGTDAVMLSAETAAGAYPVKAVQAMARVCLAAERQDIQTRSRGKMEMHFKRTDEAIAMATVYTAAKMGADAILALTESGDTALWMSRMLPGCPVFALTPHQGTRGRMTLCRGVYPVNFQHADDPTEPVAPEAMDYLKERGLLKSGHRVLLTKGDSRLPGGTNTMKILLVP